MKYREIIAEGASCASPDPAVALALHPMTDLPIVALMVGNDGQRQWPAYVMVRASDDTFLDALGSRSLIEIMADADFDPNGGEKWEVWEITPDLLLTWANGKRFPVITKSMAHNAKETAKEVVARLGIPAR